MVGLVGLLGLIVPSALLADSITVDATDVIYAAGTQSAVAGAAGGTVPVDVSAAGDSSFTFSVTGTVILNHGSGDNSNDPDGVGAAVSQSSESGSGSISGITAPDAGYLVGVFLGAGGPSGPAPAALNFTAADIGTAFTSLSPLLDQVFFIGDGLTGDGTGTVQTFYVPAGATELYLGISDSCGYNGGPSCYGDNLHSFDVTYTPASGVPEASSLSLLACGLLALGLLSNRRVLFN